jgi:hypothetical protein
VPRPPRVLTATAVLAVVGLASHLALRPSNDGPTTTVRPGAGDPPEELSAVCERIVQRKAVISDLIAGRVSATEAHARFLALNASDPTTTRSVRLLFPGLTDAERAARQVVWYVQESGHPRAAELAAAVGRELLTDDGPQHE